MDLIIGMGQTGYDLTDYYCRYIDTKKKKDLFFFDTRSKPSHKNAIEDLVGQYCIPFQSLNYAQIDANIAKIKRIYLSCAISANHLPPLLQAKILDKNYPHLYTDLDLFCSQLRVKNIPLIAITGTNGKSSVCYYLHQFFSTMGLNAPILGNFQSGFLAALSQFNQSKVDLFILELSSFQLFWSKEHYYDLSAISNIYPEHLDWHGSFAHYQQAKLKILTHSKIVVYDQQTKFIKNLNLQAKIIDAQKTCFKKLARFKAFTLLDKINQTNIVLAYCLFENYLKTKLNGGGIFALDDCIAQSLNNLKKLPFRNQIITTDSSTIWINDSKSTNTHSLMASIDNLVNQADKNNYFYLIIGGHCNDLKGLSFSDLGQYMDQLLKNNKDFQLVQIVIYGSAGQKIANDLDHLKTKIALQSLSDLKQAVQFVQQKIKQIKPQLKANKQIVLFSPGCASLSEFTSYAQRGETFNQLIKQTHI